MLLNFVQNIGQWSSSWEFIHTTMRETLIWCMPLLNCSLPRIAMSVTLLTSFVTPGKRISHHWTSHYYVPILNSALEYDPRLYGLYLHDDQLLPMDSSMWDYLDEVVPNYQDSLVLHMVHKQVLVSFENQDERWVCLCDYVLYNSSLFFPYDTVLPR